MKYTHAIVCRIPQSYRTKCEVDLDEAKKQHEAFVKLLRELGLDVIELPPDEFLPECIFVEDTAIVWNGIVLITRPGSQRSKEVSFIRVIAFQIYNFLEASNCCFDISLMTVLTVAGSFVYTSYLFV